MIDLSGVPLKASGRGRNSATLRPAFTKLPYPALVATASSILRERSGRGWLAAMTRRPLLAALVVVVAVVAVRATGTVDSDVTWQLWIGHQLSGGVRLYRDIIETNPPLWFWMAIPIDWLSTLIHVRADHVLILVIGCFAALSLIATDRILPPMARPRQALLLVFSALALVAVPWLEFGQREHIALIAALPYAALVAARRTERPVTMMLAVLVGIGAGLGFALKHYFLLVPILLELWLLTAQRRKWRPFRPETIGMVAVGALYAAAFSIWAADYLKVALPLIIMAYGVTGAERLFDLFQPAVLVALATLALLAAYFRTLRPKPFVEAFMVAAGGFGAAYFIQAKGWSYQAVPLVGLAAVALISALTSAARLPRFFAVAAPTLLFLPFWISAQEAMRPNLPARDVDHAVVGLHAGDSVGFIGTDPSLGWTTTLQRGFAYPSRYNGFWMMRAIVRNEALESPDPHLVELGRRVVRETVRDFRCLPPKRIIVARPSPEAAQAGDFDILAFFLRDLQFVQLLAHYRRIERSRVEVFALVSPLDAAHDCARRAQDDPTSTADPT
jgi:hypothetical protein